MFDFGLGSSELLVIAIVALIVIGPKDLPRLLRTMGIYMRKIQGMAREFQSHLNEAAKEAGVEDVKKEVKGMTNFTVTADLDKQGSDIKRAIESSAPKAPTAPQISKSPDADASKPASSGKPDGGPDGKDKPANTESAKASPQVAPKPRAAAKPKPAKLKAETGKKVALKPKADRAREPVKS